MRVVEHLEYYLGWVVLVGTMALRVWALVDCLIRKSAAFPAADKLTKPAWLALTVVGGLLGIMISLYVGPLSLFALITLVVSLVYLADVRPAVREISGGTRW